MALITSGYHGHMLQGVRAIELDLQSPINGVSANKNASHTLTISLNASSVLYIKRLAEVPCPGEH